MKRWGLLRGRAAVSGAAVSSAAVSSALSTVVLLALQPVAISAASPAVAAQGSAAAPSGAADPAATLADPGAAPAVPRSTGSCIEHLPVGKPRPPIFEHFPETVAAGYAAVLHIEVTHGRGETLLPSGFRLLLDSPEGKAVLNSGFRFADLDGPAAPRLSHKETGPEVVSTVELSFVALPAELGATELTLPSVPLALSRASGEVLTLCTEPHSIRITDPTANIPNAAPQQNPRALSQLEVWEAAKNGVLGALVALPVGALLAFGIHRWLRRPRPAPPPAP
jgi:hypothetical protein